jgi:NitT/TauT family transport system substrate-binding protein
MRHKKRTIDTIILAMALFLLIPGRLLAKEIQVGTWKTAQTIQPFFYNRFLAPPDSIQIFPFTNPADQKTALLAGSLDMCGTTIAHAIHSASLGQPVVLVAALCNKCSALVVKKDGPDLIQRLVSAHAKATEYGTGLGDGCILCSTGSCAG